MKRHVQTLLPNSPHRELRNREQRQEHLDGALKRWTQRALDTKGGGYRRDVCTKNLKKIRGRKIRGYRANRSGKRVPAAEGEMGGMLFALLASIFRAGKGKDLKI